MHAVIVCGLGNAHPSYVVLVHMKANTSSIFAESLLSNADIRCSYGQFFLAPSIAILLSKS